MIADPVVVGTGHLEDAVAGRRRAPLGGAAGVVFGVVGMLERGGVAAHHVVLLDAGEERELQAVDRGEGELAVQPLQTILRAAVVLFDERERVHVAERAGARLPPGSVGVARSVERIADQRLLEGVVEIGTGEVRLRTTEQRGFGLEPTIEHRVPDARLPGHHFVVRADERALSVLVGEGSGVVGVGTAAGEREVVSVAQRLAREQADPVGLVALIVEVVALADQPVIVGRAEDVGSLVDGLLADVAIVAQRGRTAAVAFRGDEDDAVRRARAVDRGGRAILQHGDALDLRSRNGVEISRNAIDEHERSRGPLEGSDATQHDLGGFGRIAAGSADREPRHLSRDE